MTTVSRPSGPVLTSSPWPNQATLARMSPADKLTLAQLCDELQIARSTFYEWRAKGRAPKCIKLPNGDLRVRRADLERCLAGLEEAHD